MIDSGREHGFGTGLLAHLERGRDGIPAGAELPAAVPAPTPEAEPKRVPDPFAEREQALDARERRLTERERELEAAFAELVRREQRLHQAPPPQGPPPQGPPPEYIRARAEREAELVWTAFSAGLVAETADGRPDHAGRIAAAQALLAELRLDPPGAAFADELAQRRELREAGL